MPTKPFRNHIVKTDWTGFPVILADRPRPLQGELFLDAAGLNDAAEKVTKGLNVPYKTCDLHVHDRNLEEG